MATKKMVPAPAVCSPINHAFVHVDTTPNAHYGNQMMGGLGQLGTVPRSFIIYCAKCGVTKKLV